jgi:hypothetical protein
MGAYECIAIPTNEAKRRMARGDAYGTSFIIRYFGITDGGHDPSDPRLAMAIDPASTTMPGGAPLFGPEPIDDVIWKTDFCPVYVCSILQGEYAGGMSSIGLFAQIVYVDPSDPDPPAMGYTFLAAVCNRPLLNLTSIDAPTFNVTIFY